MTDFDTEAQRLIERVNEVGRDVGSSMSRLANELGNDHPDVRLLDKLVQRLTLASADLQMKLHERQSFRTFAEKAVSEGGEGWPGSFGPA